MSRQDANAAFARTSFLYGSNAAYIEDLYARYESDPAAVDAEWRRVLPEPEGRSRRRHKKRARRLLEEAELAAARRRRSDRPRSTATGRRSRSASATRSRPRRRPRASSFPPTDVQQATRDSIHALMLIRAYRMRGHFHANLDPLGLEAQTDEAELDPRSYGFTEADIDRQIFLDMVLGLEFATMREILAILRRTYCQTIGVEFMHISNAAQKGWIQERIEGRDKEITFTREGKRAILNKLVEAEGFEKFLDLKFTGTKRFGLDGGESLIPALEQIIKRGGNLGVKEIVLGMPHRGRLNVLTQVMGKPHRALFHEFKGGSATPDEIEGSGDVKYHLGASSDREFDNNRVHLSLTANPRIWKSSIRWCSARCAPSRISMAIRRTSAFGDAAADAWRRSGVVFPRAAIGRSVAARETRNKALRYPLYASYRIRRVHRGPVCVHRDGRECAANKLSRTEHQFRHVVPGAQHLPPERCDKRLPEDEKAFEAYVDKVQNYEMHYLKQREQQQDINRNILHNDPVDNPDQAFDAAIADPAGQPAAD